MSNPQQPDINDLFQNAMDDGVLSQQSMQALQGIDLGQQIQAGLGVSVDTVKASEVVLVTMMVDDSGSIRFAGNAKVVREGHNAVLDALLESKQSHTMLTHTCYLNGFVLYPYQPLVVIDENERKRTGAVRYTQNSEVRKMTSKNYDPNKGTPLYDQTVVLLGRVLAKYQEFADAGVSARTVTLIITDGADECSLNASACTVKPLVEDLIGEHHVVAAMGIDDGYTNFRKVFKSMGIRDEWILTPANSASEIRKAFMVFSQSAIQVSQAAGPLHMAALGGFMNN